MQTILATVTASPEVPAINSKTTFDTFLNAVTNIPPTVPPDPESPAFANPAVARCCQAYASALWAAKERGRSEFGAANDAEAAYRRVMPPLSGAENIRDFVACVAHGMILGAFTGPTGARLLYAAQVAHTTQSAIAPKKRIRNRSKELADADPGNA